MGVLAGQQKYEYDSGLRDSVIEWLKSIVLNGSKDLPILAAFSLAGLFLLLHNEKIEYYKDYYTGELRDYWVLKGKLMGGDVDKYDFPDMLYDDWHTYAYRMIAARRIDLAGYNKILGLPSDHSEMGWNEDSEFRNFVFYKY